MKVSSPLLREDAGYSIFIKPYLNNKNVKRGSRKICTRIESMVYRMYMFILFLKVKKRENSYIK